MGVRVEEGDVRITVERDGPLDPVDIATLPHPGFATDLQAQIMVLLSLAEGRPSSPRTCSRTGSWSSTSSTGSGAGIGTSGNHAVIAGPRALSGAIVEAPDLRGGAALATAGLVAEGSPRCAACTISTGGTRT